MDWNTEIMMYPDLHKDWNYRDKSGIIRNSQTQIIDHPENVSRLGLFLSFFHCFSYTKYMKECPCFNPDLMKHLFQCFISFIIVVFYIITIPIFPFIAFILCNYKRS